MKTLHAANSRFRSIGADYPLAENGYSHDPDSFMGHYSWGIDDIGEPDEEVILAKHDSITDQMTGLRNRRGLDIEYDRLSRRISGCFAAVAIDLDDLKKENTEGGQKAGDYLILQAGKIIERTIRHNSDRGDPDIATLARMGGDEFVILLPYVVTDEQLNSFMARLGENLNEGGISASMGGSFHEHDQSLEDLVHNADMRQKAVKFQRKWERYMRLSRVRRAASYIGTTLVNFAGMPKPDKLPE